MTISSVNVGRLVDLIRVVVRRQPDAPAIEFEGRTQTYRETYEAALRLASGLRQSGLQPGDAVGILAGNSPAYLEIYLACQLAGLVAVPLNYRSVADDVAYVLGNCMARGAFVGPDYRPVLDAALPRLPALRHETIFEIERVLAQHPQILEVTVVGVPDERWGESPRACVVLQPGASATPQELLAFCDGRIARYKLPRSVEFLEALPRNAMGKVLRRELRDRYWMGHSVRVR